MRPSPSLLTLLLTLSSCTQPQPPLPSLSPLAEIDISSSDKITPPTDSLPALLSIPSSTSIDSLPPPTPLPVPLTPTALSLSQPHSSPPPPIFASLSDFLTNYQNTNPQEIEQMGFQKKIIIHKQQHVLEVYINNHLLKTYSVSLGNYIGDKEYEGDKKTPEGTFYITQKNPNSRFSLALLLNYPRKEDAAHGEELGLITPAEREIINHAHRACQTPPQQTSLGGYIEIHGGIDTRGNDDWTHGCIGLKNADIAEIYSYVDEGCAANNTGTLITIKP